MPSLLFALSLLAAQTANQKTASPHWKAVITKIGASLSVPIDLGAPSCEFGANKKPVSEAYKPAGWQGCSLRLSRRVFGKEDPDDSVAVRLEDVVFGEVDLDGGTISKVNFGLMNGWPSVDIEGKQKDNTLFRYRVCRTGSLNFVMSLAGPWLPADQTVKTLFDSFHLPKAVGAGKLPAFGPVAKAATLGDGKVDVLAPIELKDSDEIPDFGDESATGQGYSGEFGYSSYNVGIVTLPADFGGTMDDDAIDNLFKTQYGEDDDGDKVTFGEFKTLTAGGLSFRSVTYVDDTLEARVDAVVQDGKLFIFSATVPRGMLESTEAKKFFGSIKIHAGAGRTLAVLDSSPHRAFY